MQILDPVQNRYFEVNPYGSNEWIDMNALDYQPDGLGWAWLIPLASAAYQGYQGKRAGDAQAKVAKAQLAELKARTAALNQPIPETTSTTVPGFSALTSVSPVLLISLLIGAPLLFMALKK